MIFQVGDRVRNISTNVYKDEPIEVLVTFHKNKRYHVKYLNVYNVQNTNMTQWLHEDDLDFDKSYYREIKLNQILDEI